MNEPPGGSGSGDGFVSANGYGELLRNRVLRFFEAIVIFMPS
jgi:hypothetical protein